MEFESSKLQFMFQKVTSDFDSKSVQTYATVSKQIE